MRCTPLSPGPTTSGPLTSCTTVTDELHGDGGGVMTSEPGLGRERQGLIYRAGVSGEKPVVPTDSQTLEERARTAMSSKAWAYVAGGAGDGATMRHNREAFERWRVVPRMLHGTTTRDLTTRVLGTDLRAPVLLAPVGAGG